MKKYYIYEKISANLMLYVGMVEAKSEYGALSVKTFRKFNKKDTARLNFAMSFLGTNVDLDRFRKYQFETD